MMARGRHMISWVGLALLILFRQGTVQGFESPKEAIADPPWLKARLEKVRRAYHLPALAASIVIDGRVVAASAVGVRRFGASQEVTRDDAFHLGSVTKPMTATMLSQLVDRKLLDWNDTLSHLFPDLAGVMNPGYAKVTISQLLSHSSGMPYQPNTPESITDARGSTLHARRYEYTKAAVSDPPEAPPGTKVIYSGGGIIAAYAAERATKMSYETLMREHLFGPLEMTTAGFGCMASPGKLDGPWEHELKAGKLQPLAPELAQKHQTRAPVGRNVHCSIIDLGRFAAAHLPSPHGTTPFLSAEAFKVLHTKVPPLDFAPGWETAEVYWAKGQILWHSGSNGHNHSLCHVVPEENFATCVMTNVEGEGVQDACDAVNRFLVTRIRRVKTDPDAWAKMKHEGRKPTPCNVRLDDLKPIRSTTGFGTVQNGKNAAGGTLTLDGETYAQGVGVHASSELVYAMKPNYRRFVALVGIDDQQFGHGSVKAEVYLGNHRIHSSPVLRGGDSPWHIDVPLEVPTTKDDHHLPLRLVVNDGGDGQDWDLTDWVEAGFVTDSEGSSSR